MDSSEVSRQVSRIVSTIVIGVIILGVVLMIVCVGLDSSVDKHWAETNNLLRNSEFTVAGTGRSKRHFCRTCAPAHHNDSTYAKVTLSRQARVGRSDAPYPTQQV